MCTLVNITQGSACKKKGGVDADVRICNVTDIDLATTANTENVITTWAMSASAVFKKYEVSGKASIYDAPYTYTDGTTKPAITLVFNQKTAAQIKALNDLKECCNLVLCVRHARENVWRVFGIELDVTGNLVAARVEGLRVDSIADTSGTPADDMTTTVIFAAEQYDLALFATDEPPLT